MSSEVHGGPARTAYDILGDEPQLTARGYLALVEALRPVWIEEVVCPVHLAVRHLRSAAEAAAAGDDATRSGRHEAARAHLHQALSTVRLLTLEERLQEVVVDDLLRDTRVGEGRPDSGRTVHTWDGWRAH